MSWEESSMSSTHGTAASTASMRSTTRPSLPPRSTGSTSSRRRSAQPSRVAGTPTRTAPRSGRSSALSARSRSGGPPRSTAASRARCRRFDGITLASSSNAPSPSHDGARQPAFDPLVPRPIDRPTFVPLEGPLDVLDAAKILAAPDDPADWPRLARAPRRLARGCPCPDGLRRRHVRPARARLDSALLLLRPRLALGRAACTTARPGGSRRTGCSTRASASSAATTGSCSGTPTR